MIVKGGSRPIILGGRGGKTVHQGREGANAVSDRRERGLKSLTSPRA